MLDDFAKSVNATFLNSRFLGDLGVAGADQAARLHRLLDEHDVREVLREGAEGLRGNHLSNTTCPTQVFSQSGE